MGNSSRKTSVRMIEFLHYSIRWMISSAIVAFVEDEECDFPDPHESVYQGIQENLQKRYEYVV